MIRLGNKNSNLLISLSSKSSLLSRSIPNSSSRLVHTFINESNKIPGREEQISNLKSTPEFDILVIGGGATGSGDIISMF